MTEAKWQSYTILLVRLCKVAEVEKDENILKRGTRGLDDQLFTTSSLLAGNVCLYKSYGVTACVSFSSKCVMRKRLRLMKKDIRR